MNNAIQENESQAAEASGVSNELNPGITIDLSRKKIHELPAEVVDIFKHELERSVITVNPPRWQQTQRSNLTNVLNFSGV